MDDIQVSQQFFLFLPMKDMKGHFESVFLAQSQQDGAHDEVHACVRPSLPWQYPTSGRAITNALSTTFIRSSKVFAYLCVGKVLSRSRFTSLFSHRSRQSSKRMSGSWMSSSHTLWRSWSHTPSLTSLITLFSPYRPEFLSGSMRGNSNCHRFFLSSSSS